MNATNQPCLDQFGFCFDNSYSKLPEVLFTPSNPKQFENPSLVIFFSQVFIAAPFPAYRTKRINT